MRSDVSGGTSSDEDEDEDDSDDESSGDGSASSGSGSVAYHPASLDIDSIRNAIVDGMNSALPSLQGTQLAMNEGKPPMLGDLNIGDEIENEIKQEDTTGSGNTVPPAISPASSPMVTGALGGNLLGENFGKLGTVVESPNLQLNGMTDYAAGRADTRGVSSDVILDTVQNPMVVLQQSTGRFLYLSSDAGVVLNSNGKVITTYPSSMFDANINTILNYKK